MRAGADDSFISVCVKLGTNIDLCTPIPSVGWVASAFERLGGMGLASARVARYLLACTIINDINNITLELRMLKTMTSKLERSR